jgi:hypothetical protein
MPVVPPLPKSTYNLFREFEQGFRVMQKAFDESAIKVSET